MCKRYELLGLPGIHTDGTTPLDGGLWVGSGRVFLYMVYALPASYYYSKIL